MTDSTECATGCGRPSPSAALCGDCTTSLRATLQLAIAIEDDLLDAIARQLRHGGSGPRGTENPLPYDPAASDARRALALALGTAIYALIGAAWPIADPTIGGMAWWLREHMAEVAVSPHAGRDHDAIRHAVDRCVMVLDGRPERHPAGDCTGCGRALLAPPDADTVTCQCGTVAVGIMASRAARAAAADVLGSSDVIAAALAGIGIKVAGGTIRKWVERRRLTPRPGGAIAMSDVLVLVAERDARKAVR